MINLGFDIHDKRFEFNLTYDPDFIADRMTQVFMAKEGACEPEVLHLMVRAIKPGDTVLDGGANIGFFTIVMALLVGEQGKVLAFEPGTNNIDKLQENIKANKLTNVRIFQEALWSNIDSRGLYLSPDSGLNSLANFEESVSSAPVYCTFIDDLVDSPSFIKLDIEGAEFDVLEGAGVLLERYQPYVVCEANVNALNRFGHSLEQIRGYMYDLGYNTFILHKDGALPSMVPERTVFKPSANNRNVLFATPYMVGKAWPEVVV